MRVVLDTNVLISALAFPESKPDQILSRIRRREIDFFVSPSSNALLLLKPISSSPVEIRLEPEAKPAGARFQTPEV